MISNKSMNNQKSLSHSLEDYLEAILVLETENRVARVRDIAAHLQVQMPSVTGALKSLKEKGLIEYERNSYIYLSPQGKKIAERILDRHGVLVRFLREVLFIPDDKAEEQACRIEHVIDTETATRIKNCTDLLLGKFEKSDFFSKNEWREKIQQ